MFLNITDTGQFCASIASHQCMNDFCVKHIKQWKSNKRHTLKKRNIECASYTIWTVHVSCCAIIVQKTLVPRRLFIFAFVCPSSRRKVTNRPLDCLIRSWGLTSTCPVWRRITTEMLGHKKHVVVMKKTKSTITVYFKNTDVRKKQGECVSARY